MLLTNNFGKFYYVHIYIYNAEYQYTCTSERVCVHVYVSTMQLYKRMSKCVHIHAYIHAYIRTYIHTYTQACLPACVHAGRQACIHMYIHLLYACVHACRCVYVYNIHLCTYIYICMYMCMYLRTRGHALHTYIHMSTFSGFSGFA